MPKGLQKVRISFDAEGLTRFGGLVLFQRFCKSLVLRRFLQTYVQWPDYNQKLYHPADVFLAHLYAIVAGIGRIQNTQSLIHNGLLPHLLGLPNLPHRDTLRDFLRRFTPNALRSLQSAHDKIRRNLFLRLGPVYSSTIDMDTTALTVFGHQEGATIGYNPAHRGRTSYCPILSSEGKIGLSMNFELRSGNVHSSTGAVLFLQETLNKLPQTVSQPRTRIRADTAFFDKDIIQFLDGNNIEYVIVARSYSPIQKLLPGIRYHQYQKNWSAGEFQYQPHFWEKKHRFIAIRNFIKESDSPSTLFAIQDYSYRVLVTNLELQPEKIWRIYCSRANQELLIRELKNSYSLAKIPTNSFIANQAYLETVLWAYDLIMTFKALCLPQECKKWNISTLRMNLFQLPAELVRPGNYNRLRLPTRFQYQEIFQHAQRTALKIKPLL